MEVCAAFADCSIQFGIGATVAGNLSPGMMMTLPGYLMFYNAKLSSKTTLQLYVSGLVHFGSAVRTEHGIGR